MGKTTNKKYYKYQVIWSEEIPEEEQKEGDMKWKIITQYFKTTLDITKTLQIPKNSIYKIMSNESKKYDHYEIVKVKIPAYTVRMVDDKVVYDEDNFLG